MEYQHQEDKIIKCKILMYRQMKEMIKYVLILMILIVSMASSCDDKYQGKMVIRNNSDKKIYYWYAHWIYDKNHTNYHYPDTILPSKIPTYSIWFVGSHNKEEISGVSRTPNYKKIFSELPAGKFSIYIFTELPETQAEWDLIRENYNLIRKDITYQELIDNDFYIDFP